MRFIQLAAAVALLLPTGLATAHAAQPDLTPVVLPMEENTTAGYARTILAKVNELRAGKGLAPVTRYRELDAIATDWSQQMATQASLSHRPNFTNHYPSGWSNAAENVAMHGGSGDIGAMMFDLWLNSPGHYANMVNPELNSIGIGLAHDPVNNAWYATQNFANYSDAEAATLTKVGGESPRPRPSPTPDPSTPPSPPAPSPSKESTPPQSPTPSPTPTPSEPDSPTPEGQDATSPSASGSRPAMTLPSELVEDPTPSSDAPMVTPSATTSEPTPTPSPSIQPPGSPAALAELDEAGPSWGMISLGVALTGTAVAGLVFLFRRLF
ncbi:MAG: CAP domain-containing protein [Arachnia propionica]|uniref:CAP domain-containing protein n=1 Tax=Arachnia propionica TaxID=1750 RepID=UPI00270D09B5|nr:CAP domain-containing protein [Arachnia propionica]